MGINLNLEIDLSVIAFIIMIGFVLFGITQCAMSDSFNGVYEDNDYQECINKCPKDFNGDFKDLECPQMCAQLLNNTVETEPEITVHNTREFLCKIGDTIYDEKLLFVESESKCKELQEIWKNG